MATSSITITALTATPTLRGNKLVATVSATGPAANIPTLMLDNVEFYSSASNDFTTATKVGEGNPEFLHAGLIEEQTYYYWAKPRAVNLSYGAVFPVSPTGGVACTATGMSGIVFGLANGKLIASTSGGALTIAIKTAAGNDPSASDPVFVAFPNSNVTIGNYQIRVINAALSITVPSGQSLGVATNNTPFVIWVVIFDDSGTLRLGVKVASNSAALVSPINEGALASSSAVASAALSYVYYTTTVVTAKPLRLIGQCIWNSGLATAGTYTDPDATRLVPPGIRGPGARLPAYSALDAGTYTTTAVIPFDDTIPQVGEGLQLDSFAFTARASANIIEIESAVNVSHSVVSEIVGALFVDGAANAVASDCDYVDTAGKLRLIKLKFRVRAGSTSSRTYSIRIGPSQAGTLTLNGSGGSRKLGGVLSIVTNADEIEG